MQDLTNQKFGHLTVIKQAEDYVSPSGSHVVQWECQCDCGAKIVTRGYALLSGHTKGCGQKHRRYEDLTGRHFGRLTVISQGEDELTSKGARHIRWNCKCECGRETLVRGTFLRNGHTQSCGHCSRSESNLGKNAQDITGQHFGRWTVICENGRLLEPRGRYVKLWKCRCECGEERNLRAGTLKQGLSLSCGCFKYERLAEIAKAGTRSSKLEFITNSYLQQNGFYYEPQMIYPDLRSESGYPLSYDFLVYVSGEPNTLIECQGKQHYQPVEYFGGEKQFAIQQQNDEKKRRYANKIGLTYLEIPYTLTEDAIIQLLNNHFNTKGSV